MTRKSVRPRATAIPTIQASTFKATCLELMDELAARGSEIIVTKHGRPVVKVGPVDDAPVSPFGFMRNTIVAYGDVVGPELDQWESSPTDPLEIDNSVPTPKKARK